jgi:hypothetical protein
MALRADRATHKSKLSFQYGFSVRFDTVVVLVCSPLTVATAKGSGKPETVRGGLGAGIRNLHTKDISFVESIGGNDYGGRVSHDSMAGRGRRGGYSSLGG